MLRALIVTNRNVAHVAVICQQHLVNQLVEMPLDKTIFIADDTGALPDQLIPVHTFLAEYSIKHMEGAIMFVERANMPGNPRKKQTL